MLEINLKLKIHKNVFTENDVVPQPGLIVAPESLLCAATRRTLETRHQKTAGCVAQC